MNRKLARNSTCNSERNGIGFSSDVTRFVFYLEGVNLVATAEKFASTIRMQPPSVNALPVT